MTNQNTFMDTVKSVAEIVRTSAEPLSEREILAYFDDMELDDNQKKLVLEYLKNSQPEQIIPGDEAGETEIEKVGNTLDLQDREDSARSAVFSMYLEELSYLPDYSEEEKHQMYESLLKGDQSVIKLLSDCWLKKVIVIAKKYTEPKLNMEDLIQEGNMALFLTLQNLCGSGEKADVEDVLEKAVEEGIMLYASEMNNQRELENTILGKVSLVYEAKKLLTEENGCEPSVQELADYTKMSVEELQDVMEMGRMAGRNS